MQAGKFWLVQNTLAAGANRKKAPTEFFCENYLCNPNGLLISFAFLLFPYRQCLLKKVDNN